MTKNIIILFSCGFIYACGGGGGGDLGTSSSNQSNVTPVQLVNVVCSNGLVVKGKNANDFSSCPVEKIPAKLISINPVGTASSTYSPVTVEFDKMIKSGSAKCSIIPIIPNVKCTVDYSSSGKLLTAKDNGSIIIFPIKNASQYTVVFSNIIDESEQKISDVKITFQSHSPASISTNNGYKLATIDHLLNSCEKASVLSTVYWPNCLVGLSFTGTTDPLNKDYCEIGFNQDGSISYFVGSESYRTISSSIYLKNSKSQGQFNFQFDGNGSFILGALSNYENDFNGQTFSVVLNANSNKWLLNSGYNSESLFRLTEYKDYSVKKNVDKKCFINSIV